MANPEDQQSKTINAREFLVLGLFLAICFVIAAIGSFLTFPSLSPWYANLEKPSWNPPNYLFGPVWTSLYTMMAISAWLVWLRERELFTGWPMRFFFLQLVLNCIWSGLFFALKSPGIAFIEILFLWIAIAGCIVFFFRVRPIAAWIMIPYFLWVSFAACLNFTIWRLN